MKIGTSTVTAIYLGTTSIVSAYLGSTQVFGGASAFTPLSLFSSGSQGIWLDPSDLSTMFSDRAGTTPVTTPGTVVGLRLDKSKGLVLGAELVTGGSDVSKWVARGSNTVTSIAGGVEIAFVGGSLSDFGAYSYLNADGIGSQNLSTAKTYIVSLDAQCIGGTASVAITNFSEGYTSALVGGTATRISFRFRPLVSNPYMQCSSLSTGESIKLTNISVRELAGNHAVAPTDAARPIYGVEPKGGRRNLLTYSEQFNTSIWLAFGGASKTGTDIAVAPDGTTTADSIRVTTSGFGSNIYQQPTYTVAAVPYTFSCWVKRNAASDQTFQLFNNLQNAQSFSGNLTATDTWQRFSLTSTPNAGTGLMLIGIIGNTSGNQADLLVWGAQLELGSTATAYQRVTTAYDVTESGVATCHYVQYDGSDDSMSTSAIDFTATDKMSVFAGVRKLSDANYGMIAESSAGFEARSFGLYVGFPNTPGAAYSAMSRGNAPAGITQYVSVAAASPDAAVLTVTHDISGDLTTIRRNAVAGTSSTADKGTGNFGNYPLFIGRRNNATLPFNGKDFGIVIVGKAASAGEITDTETWLAARTAQVTL